MLCVGEELFTCYTTTGHTEPSLLFQYHTASLVCFWQFKIYNSLNHPTFMFSFKDFFFLLMWTIFKVSVEFVIILLLCFGLLAVRHMGSSLSEVLMSNVISGLKSMSPKTLLLSSPCSFISSASYSRWTNTLQWERYGVRLCSGALGKTDYGALFFPPLQFQAKKLPF